jgi:hypothetical protein
MRGLNDFQPKGEAIHLLARSLGDCFTLRAGFAMTTETTWQGIPQAASPRPLTG